MNKRTLFFLIAIVISNTHLNGMMRSAPKKAKFPLFLNQSRSIIRSNLVHELSNNQPLTMTRGDKIFLATGATTLTTLFALNRGYFDKPRKSSRSKKPVNKHEAILKILQK